MTNKIVTLIKKEAIDKVNELWRNPDVSGFHGNAPAPNECARDMALKVVELSDEDSIEHISETAIGGIVIWFEHS